MTSTRHFDSLDDNVDSKTSAAEQIDIQFYLRILRKNKWAITFFTTLVTMLAAYYAYSATPIYQSTSTLLIESQKANILSIEELYGVEKENGDYYQTQYEILRSRALADRVVKRLGLDKAATVTPESTVAEDIHLDAGDDAAVAPNGLFAKLNGFFINFMEKLELGDIDTGLEAAPSSAQKSSLAAANGKSADDVYDTLESMSDAQFNRAVNGFRRGLSIDPVRKTKLVKISYESPDPEFSALVANTVAEEYILSVLDGRMRMKEQAYTWMNERVALLKTELDESESRLISFKADNGLIDVNGSVGRLNEQELLLATTELAQAKSELSDAQDLYREVSSLQTSAPELLKTVPAIQNDPLVRSVEIEFGQRKREIDELSNRYGTKHPKIVDAQSRLDSLQRTLDGHIGRVVGSIQKDYQLRRQRVSSIQGSLNKGKENIQIIGQKKFKLDALEREVETNREIYNQFFSRIAETNSSDGLDAANARISDVAVPTGRPIAPKKATYNFTRRGGITVPIDANGVPL